MLTKGRAYIIAEAGVNHNGNIELARQLVEAAAAAHCDAVKFQLFKTDKLVAAGAKRAPYQGQGSQESLLCSLELSGHHLGELVQHARRLGMDCIASPFDLDSARLLHEMDVPFMKISSGEINNLSFLRDVGMFGRPTMLSTGTATLGETETAVAAIAEGLAQAPRRAGRWDDLFGKGIVLMHCVTSYPAPIDQVNLRAMTALAAAFDYPTGYSDHTVGLEASIAAVAMGACAVEKHFTLDKILPGPDHAASASPSELAAMVQAIRRVEAALGDGIKRPASCERENMRVVRRSLCAARPLENGRKLSKEDIIPLRAGKGIGAEKIDWVIGRTLRRPVGAKEPLGWEDLFA